MYVEIYRDIVASVSSGFVELSTMATIEVVATNEITLFERSTLGGARFHNPKDLKRGRNRHKRY